MKGGLGNMMKQAQKLQEDMKKAQEELKHLEVTGSAGGGMVSITMTGRYEVKRVELDDSLMEDDKDMIEDLVAAAMNDAVRKVEETTQERFSGLASGMGGLPGGMNFP